MILITQDFCLFLKSYMRLTLLSTKDVSGITKIPLKRIETLTFKKHELPTLEEVITISKKLKVPKEKALQAYFSSILLNFNIFEEAFLVSNEDRSNIYKISGQRKRKTKRKAFLLEEFKSHPLDKPLLFSDILRVREKREGEGFKNFPKKRLKALKAGALPTIKEIEDLFLDTDWCRLKVELNCYFNSVLKKEKLDFSVEMISLSDACRFLDRIYFD